MQDAFWTYSRQVLAHQLGSSDQRAANAVPKAADDPVRNLRKIRRVCSRNQGKRLVVLGMGGGDVAAGLQGAAEGIDRTVFCVLDVDGFREAAPDWWREDGPVQVMADTSPWAHVYMLMCNGFTPDASVYLRNPELDSRQAHEGGYATLHRMLKSLHLKTLPAEQPDRRARPSCTVACILRPDEPELEGFFGQIPDWVDEVSVVWDGRAPANHPGRALGDTLRESARALDDDFARQRNVMLEQCSGDWVLYLDGDERLAAEVWEALPQLMECGATGVYLPRRTFFPDSDHVKAGYGLWPDLQLRLFRRTSGLRFIGPVHERLEGLAGPVALSLDMAIDHYNHVYKDAATVSRKLEQFDRAGGHSIRHTLSEHYPHLPVAFFEAMQSRDLPGRVLMPASGV